MRVIHIIKMTGLAGAENHLLALLSGLRARGIDARFLVMVTPANPVTALDAAAAARDIPVARLVIRHHADLTVYPRLWRRLRALKPDIVHTHLQHGDLYGIPAARLAGVPVVITSRHNDDIRRRHPALRVLNRALWGMVDAGITISDAIGRFSIEVEGASPQKVQTIHYGLEDMPPGSDRAEARAALRGELGLTDDTLLAGIVARLILVKGIPYALKAMRQIASRFPTAHLLIVGDGPLRNELEAETAALSLADRVHFLGWRQDVPQIMAGLDVLLMPSLREGFGLSMLEAMAQGVPIIGSAVSAIPEVIADGETGLLCPARDVDALAAAMAKLLADPALRERMGAAGRARLEAHFRAERMVNETAALYGRLLAAKKAAAG